MILFALLLLRTYAPQPAPSGDVYVPDLFLHRGDIVSPDAIRVPDHLPTAPAFDEATVVRSTPRP